MVGDVNVGFMQSFAKLCCGHPFVHELRTGCDFRFPEGKICTSKEIFNRSEGLKYSGNLQAFKGPLTTWYSTAKTDHYNTRTLYTTLYTVGRVSRKKRGAGARGRELDQYFRSLAGTSTRDGL